MLTNKFTFFALNSCPWECFRLIIIIMVMCCSSTSVTGLNNNEYQISRGKVHAYPFHLCQLKELCTCIWWIIWNWSTLFDSIPITLICLPWCFQNGIEAHCLYYFAGTKSHCRSWQDLWFCEGWFCSWCKFKFLLISYLLSTFILFHLYSLANLVYLV